MRMLCFPRSQLACNFVSSIANDSFSFKFCYGIACLSALQRMGRDNSVGISTRYGLDGPGIESR